jgi:hypothetical protein
MVWLLVTLMIKIAINQTFDYWSKEIRLFSKFAKLGLLIIMLISSGNKTAHSLLWQVIYVKEQKH